MVMKRKTNKIKDLEFRLDHIEMALLNLMFVVANQEDELPTFKKGLKKAEKISKTHKEFIDLIIKEEGGEA
jgi:hypothetical protein